MRKLSIISILVLVSLFVALSGRSSAIGQGAASSQTATVAATMAATPSDPLGGATTFAKVDQPTTVTMMLDWTPNTNHLGIYAADALGYYKDANLTVKIQQAGDISVEQVVGSGKAEFGVSYQEETTMSRSQKVPIVSVAAVIQHNTSGFAALHNKHPLKTPADLVGLNYGSFDSPIEKPMLDALLKCAGVDSDIKPIKFISVGSAEPIPLMEQNKIDFVWLFYAWDGIRAKQQGIQLDFLMLSDFPECVPDYYTPLLITNQDMINNHSDVVKAFIQATARGYAYAIQNPDKAADILLKAAPDLDAKLVRESSEWLTSQFQAEAVRWGEQSPDVWKNFVDFAATNQVISAPIDINAAYSNDFLPGTDH